MTGRREAGIRVTWSGFLCNRPVPASVRKRGANLVTAIPLRNNKRAPYSPFASTGEVAF
jgi:hypothetical protein